MRASRSSAVPQHRDRPVSTRGFTMIEVLITISILVMLMSLILPAVQSARQASLRVQCQNHLRNIALAALNYASINQQFPTLHSRMDINRGSGPQSEWFPWPVTLLPLLDQSGLYDAWATGPRPESVMKIFTCPNDNNNWQQAGGLSYVMNCGYGIYTGCCLTCSSDDTGSVYNSTPSGASAGIVTLTTTILDDLRTTGSLSGVTISVNSSPPNVGWDWNQDGQVTVADHLLFKGTGVTWNPVEGLAVQCSSDDVSRGDGGAQTLLLAENTKATGWAAVSSLWVPGPGDELVVSPELSTMSARFLATIRHKGFGLSTQVFRDSSNEHVFPGTQYQFTAQTNGLLGFDSLVESPGMRPRCGPPPKPPAKLVTRLINSGDSFDPNSNHPGGVYVAFCDGHLQFLSNETNPTVYARLLTSDGVHFGQIPDAATGQ